MLGGLCGSHVGIFGIFGSSTQVWVGSTVVMGWSRAIIAPAVITAIIEGDMWHCPCQGCWHFKGLLLQHLP